MTMEAVETGRQTPWIEVTKKNWKTEDMFSRSTPGLAHRGIIITYKTQPGRHLLQPQYNIRRRPAQMQPERILPLGTAQRIESSLSRMNWEKRIRTFSSSSQMTSCRHRIWASQVPKRIFWRYEPVTGDERQAQVYSEPTGWNISTNPQLCKTYSKKVGQSNSLLLMLGSNS